MPLPGISSGNNKSVMCPPIICLPPEEGKKSEEQQCCSKTASDDDSRLERNSSRKTIDTEYSFEEVILFVELMELLMNTQGYY